MVARIGLLPLARSTFDVPFAEENLAAMLALLDEAGVRISGSRALLPDADSARLALREAIAAEPDLVLILQVTFTDAATTAEIAEAFGGSLAIWSIPEPRVGGRLRLNSFCGLNLASHALGLRGRQFAWLHMDPKATGAGAALGELLGGGRRAVPLYPDAVADTPADSRNEAGRAIADALQGARIGRIGEHPAGFDTCSYDDDKLTALANVEVDAIDLEKLFSTARDADAASIAALRAGTAREVEGLDAVNQEELDRSLALRLALDTLRGEGRYDAFAIRCWPETFTEYGGAVCGAVSMLGEARAPCACEADVYGALTQLLLQRVAEAPVFLTDLVDIDSDDDSAVVWHCGQAPISMMAEGERALATIHSNRRMPLLLEFALKPGRVTFARISQARGRQFLAIASGEMLERGKSFTGTSGVVRFDTPAGEFAGKLIDSGLEHHMALAYGDHVDALRSAACALGLPVLRM